MKLSNTLGKTIADFCKNKFTGAGENHCAHFVCHVLHLDLGYDCKTHRGGSQPGACLRVHELFAACPQVGHWKEATDGVQLVFVTDKSNVNLAAHTMRNVTRKHVGIFSAGYIYHYANTQEAVVRQTPADFLARFHQSYGGQQGLFFGTFPPEARVPDPENGNPSPATPLMTTFPPEYTPPMAVIREVQAGGGKVDYFASLPGTGEYYVARSTKYGAYRGLMQPASRLTGPRYDAAAFQGKYESVAGMLGVIGHNESSGYFNRLNTYDRAAFTFGFFQLAAHTPNDNLVLLFRRALAEHAPFRTLFPDLKLLDGVLHRDLGTHAVSLEKPYPRPGHPGETNLKDFMNYLNRDGAKIDEGELSSAARLIHLANTDNAFNRLQVTIAAQITMRKLRHAYSIWYNLNGVSDMICTAIADIHHQGRGTKTEVRKALSSASTVQGKVSALCKVGEAIHGQRCLHLKKALEKAAAAQELGVSVFDSASGLFKPNQGWPV